MQDLAPLRALERQRAEFLGMVSHELRAPLTSIKGSTATVLGGSRVIGTAEVRQFFRIIDRQADRMDALIGDLLDAGRIEAGTLSVTPEPTEVAMLVEQARNTFITGGGRHPVLIDIAEDLPQVLADRERIVQVLNNLLTNAARAAPESSPIRIGAEAEGVYVAVWVADEGRGMEPARLARLFARRSATAADGGRAPGGGLGLSICKGLVEAHGGRIRAESDGVGSGLRVTFTVSAAGGGAVGASGASWRGAGREKHEGLPILAVDDDPETLRHVRDALAEAQFAPIVTADPGEIERIVKAERPRLVLLDLMLPDTDGIELMRTVPALAELPVIFISGYGRDETIARALEAGAGRLYRQAVLPHRTHRAGACGAAPALGAGAVRARGARHQLRAPPGERGRARRGAHRHGVRTAARAVAQRRAYFDAPMAARAGLGRTGPQRSEDRARLRQAVAPQARRRRSQTGVDLQRARRGLRHAAPGRGVVPVALHRPRAGAATAKEPGEWHGPSRPRALASRDI